ncbi:hypothetical protein M0804_009217 [Polistes exclamans]|nr:hypothetical protein M0804_009217 [Polistes exclamans]
MNTTRPQRRRNDISSFVFLVSAPNDISSFGAKRVNKKGLEEEEEKEEEEEEEEEEEKKDSFASNVAAEARKA